MRLVYLSVQVYPREAETGYDSQLSHLTGGKMAVTRKGEWSRICHLGNLDIFPHFLEL